MLTASLLLAELQGRITCAAVGVDINPFGLGPGKEFSRIDVNFDGPPAIGGYAIAKLLGTFEKSVVI